MSQRSTHCAVARSRSTSSWRPHKARRPTQRTTPPLAQATSAAPPHSIVPAEPSATPVAFAPWLKNLRAELKAIATKLARLEAGRLADDSDSGSGSDDDAPRAPADAAAVRRDTEELAARHGRPVQLVHGELLPLPRSDEALFLAAAGGSSSSDTERPPPPAVVAHRPPLPPTPPSAARRSRRLLMAAVAISSPRPSRATPPKRRAELLTICEAAL